MIRALILGGCRISSDNVEKPMEESRERFSVRREDQDGATVACNGYSERYEPGEDAEFDITIKNDTGQIWDGAYCLQLMARESPVVIETMHQQQFTLTSGDGFSETITVRLPDNLDDGGYGLSLVVRKPVDPMVDMVSIQVGETNEIRQPATQDDRDASLLDCPLVNEVSADDPQVLSSENEEFISGERIFIEGDSVNGDQVTISGTSTLPSGSCVNTELWADGTPVIWWPTNACISIQEGSWKQVVVLEPDQALQPNVQYMIRAYQSGGPDIVATFPFDLNSPPNQSSPSSGE